MTEQTTSVYVDRYYEMDPTYEDLIPGSDLTDGMIVLVEDPLARADLRRAHNDGPTGGGEMRRLRENNRWCQVTSLTVDRTMGNDVVKFVALYADGTKFPRSCAASRYWLVKKASIDEVTP